MMYEVPGHADRLSNELVERWNDAIRSAYESLRPALREQISLWIRRRSLLRCRLP